MSGVLLSSTRVTGREVLAKGDDLADEALNEGCPEARFRHPIRKFVGKSFLGLPGNVGMDPLQAYM
jgi:hypothetical protein